MAPVTDLQEDDDELDCLYEETGEAEASRERPRRRVWPWVLLGTGLPVAITLTTCAMTGQRVMQEPAAAVVTTPPPPPLRPAVPEASTGAAAAPAPAAGPSTPPPASTRAVVVVREASALASTNRAEAARTKAEEVEKSRAAARQGAQQQVAQREGERPGVNRAAPWVNEHPEFTIPSHTPISCTPDGPINSEAQGPITCTIDAAVRSEDGTNFLLWPGAVIEGYLSSGLQYGQRRLMVAFERIRTTDYVRIPLRGIGASQLGENGITGTYDSHLWEKIQAGVLLTVIEGAVDAGVGALTSSLQSGGGNQFLNFGNVGSRARGTLGQSALQQDYNRPPTLRRDHADSITVRTVGDLDLSSIYELREVRDAAARAGVPTTRRQAR